MFYDTVAEGYVLRIRVTPNASKCGVSGTFSDSIGAVFLKISLISVPEKGKANQELIKYLAKTLHESKGSFSLLSGETDRCKKIFLQTAHSPEAAANGENVMTAQVLDGKKLAQSVRLGLKQKIDAFPQIPGLAVIIAGNNPASEIYVRSKEKACRETGIIPYTYRLPADTSADELLSLIQKLNASPEINGILVQLPLPAHMDTTQILGAVTPEKDVDGFHPLYAGLVV